MQTVSPARRAAAASRLLSLLLAATLAFTMPAGAQDGGGSGGGDDGGGGGESAPQQETLRPVRLMTVTPPTTQVRREFFGRVVARETVDLAFQVAGQLHRLPVSNGQEVARGDLLAQLDLAPFERAVERAELNLDQARRDFRRASDLAQRNVGAEVEAENARTARDLAEVELRDARDDLENATITAAFDGLVAQRLIANYATVDVGTPVLRLHDMSQPRVEVAIPERLFRFAGDLSDIGFSADLGDGRTDVPLTLAEFAAETEGVSQTYRVDLALPELDGYTPIPGRSATVTVSLDREGGDGLIVPVTAIVATPDRRNQVMRFTPKDADVGTVQPVEVTVMSREGASLAVRADEQLEPGMEIVATGAHLLHAGQQVRRYAGFGDGSGDGSGDGEG